MLPATSIAHDGRGVLLKWHQLRQRPGDPPFAIANLRAGLAVAASLEIDIRRLADDTWVCLHDDVLEGETDGTGPVSTAGSAAIRRLRMAGSDDAPQLLADIANEVATAVSSPACLQLDLKEPLSGLTDRSVARFAEVIAPIARICLLSGTDWLAVWRLGGSIAGLRLGYDPLDLLATRNLTDADSISAFVGEIIEMAPAASALYVDHRFAGMALARRVDLFARLKTNGAKVDVWTLDTTTPGIETILPTMVAAGADQITTNDPIGLAALWHRLG